MLPVARHCGAIIHRQLSSHTLGCLSGRVHNHYNVQAVFTLKYYSE